MHQKHPDRNHDSNVLPQYDSWSQSLDRQSQGPLSRSQIQPTIDDSNDLQDYFVLPHSTQNSGILPTAAIPAIPTANSLSNVDASFFSDQLDTILDILPQAGVDNLLDNETFAFINQIEQATKEATQPSPRLDIMWPNWPPNLPPPHLLQHLCVLKQPVILMFSLSLSDSLTGPASKYFSRSTRMLVASSMPPVSWHRCLSPLRIRTFPSLPFFMLSVLSARCILQQYHLHPCRITPKNRRVSSLLKEDFYRLTSRFEGEIFRQKYRDKEKSPESFAEEQARRAKDSLREYASVGEQVIQVMQGDCPLILSIYIH